MEKDSQRIAENDILRSEYIRKLIQTPSALKKQHFTTKIPRLIIQFWDDLSKIPKDVQECIDSWNSFIPKNFKRFIFDDQSARNFIKDRFGLKYVEAFNLCHHAAMRCDYFRLCFMLMVGGFYVDADEVYQGNDLEYLFNDNVLKIQPLCYDNLSNSMVQPSVFFKNGRCSPNWIFYVNNNPIIAPPRHPIIHIALERATRILLRREEEHPDIQSTTGPGNLSASLVMHWISLESGGNDRDFYFLSDWENISISRWPLNYRNDERNWRIWNSILSKDKCES